MTETTHSPNPSSPQSISRDDIKFFETPVIPPQTQVTSKPALTQADDEFSKLFSVLNYYLNYNLQCYYLHYTMQYIRYKISILNVCSYPQPSEG